MRIISQIILASLSFGLLSLATVAEPLSKAPTHRYRFNGSGAGGARIVDVIGGAHGTLVVRGGGSKLSGDGQLVLDALAWDAEVQLPTKWLQATEDFTLEAWYTPEADDYDWHIVFRLDDDRGNKGDFFWYALRTLRTHRVEIADDGLNDSIQHKDVPLAKGRVAHIVVVYDDQGRNERPVVKWFVNGKEIAKGPLKVRLGDLVLKRFLLGPTKGRFDEFRIYDHALTAAEVEGSFKVGPEKVVVAN